MDTNYSWKLLFQALFVRLLLFQRFLNLIYTFSLNISYSGKFYTPFRSTYINLWRYTYFFKIHLYYYSYNIVCFDFISFHPGCWRTGHRPLRSRSEQSCYKNPGVLQRSHGSQGKRAWRSGKCQINFHIFQCILFVDIFLLFILLLTSTYSGFTWLNSN